MIRMKSNPQVFVRLWYNRWCEVIIGDVTSPMWSLMWCEETNTSFNDGSVMSQNILCTLNWVPIGIPGPRNHINISASNVDITIVYVCQKSYDICRYLHYKLVCVQICKKKLSMNSSGLVVTSRRNKFIN